VHPIHYHVSLGASNKVCMTEARVEEMNSITLRELNLLAPSVGVLDLWGENATSLVYLS